MSQHRDNDLLFDSVVLNYYTTAATLRVGIESNIDKVRLGTEAACGTLCSHSLCGQRSGRVYGPALPKRLVYFIDDLNMPSVDLYDTQSPIALLRQHIDSHHW